MLEAVHTPHTSQVSGASRPVIMSVPDGVRSDILTGAMRETVRSAMPGHTFGEVSRDFHKASDHGSLHVGDSGSFAPASALPLSPRITDVAPTLLSHFAGIARGRRLGL